MKTSSLTCQIAFSLACYSAAFAAVGIKMAVSQKNDTSRTNVVSNQAVGIEQPLSAGSAITCPKGP
jgi:hypothetical protein